MGSTQVIQACSHLVDLLLREGTCRCGAGCGRLQGCFPAARVQHPDREAGPTPPGPPPPGTARDFQRRLRAVLASCGRVAGTVVPLFQAKGRCVPSGQDPGLLGPGTGRRVWSPCCLDGRAFQPPVACFLLPF